MSYSALQFAMSIVVIHTKASTATVVYIVTSNASARLFFTVPQSSV